MADYNRQVAINTKAQAESRALIVKKLKELDGKEITMKVRANENGHLFKGVSKKEVAFELGSNFFDPSIIVDLASPIKEVGEYVINLASEGAEASVHLIIEALSSIH